MSSPGRALKTLDVALYRFRLMRLLPRMGFCLLSLSPAKQSGGTSRAGASISSSSATLGALLSWRIEAIEAESFSCVLLSVMEAIAQVARPNGVMALDLARVCEEATARTDARRMLGEEQRS
jgi:hypothetical protein